ncbi:tRNA pseudouridine synthase B [Secundilactobacillus pentosiphilus]|uniref:tRNA pseudouridine synthase B n=1 Tax=Secundilactobacillus pentosiphilus TaxID=1714682 RepID=A0A1Z5IMI8_9LACO|nr:tRNA pseudouridine(55) synthase TruB [Secundilactobacillus pentosiphilus]GAX02980.1 tRNA pseudouridine synthase B [Secundilactobacillus pentosiphilus]GAX05987.1 tRNA pseudouridine synthase B [Secundilactobacillus pentosiphilus]
MDGIIPLYKERGMTSHDCVNHVRKIVHMKKVGHSGTLDPNVDGVLPICVGSATKVVDYLMTHQKVYRGSVTLGFATETEDLDGAEVKRVVMSEPVPDEKIDAVMAGMVGELSQVPPMYSAVKVNGRKLYEYARSGQEVERPVRTVTIKSFKRTSDSQFDAAAGTQRFDFEVACTKGTYVRTLAVQIGTDLGLPAVMSSLTRVESGGFTINETVSLDTLREQVANDAVEFLYPIDRVLTQYPTIEISDEIWSVVKNGVWLLPDEVNTDAPVISLKYQGQIKCLYQRVKDRYKPLKMFSTK